MSRVINDSQFGSHPQDYLDHVQKHTGVEVHGDHLRFPTGETVHTARTTMSVAHPPGGEPDVSVYAHVPSETGNLHLVSVHAYGSRPDMSNVAAEFGTDHAFWSQHGPKKSRGSNLTMKDFPGRLKETIASQPSPSPEKRQENSGRLQQWAPDRGKIVTDVTKWGAGTSYANAPTKYSKYNPSTGEDEHR